MEPADQVQEAVRLQDVRLRQQAGEISALHQGMETIRANVQLLVERLTPQLVAQPTPPPPTGILPQASIKPRLPAPKRYAPVIASGIPRDPGRLFVPRT